MSLLIAIVFVGVFAVTGLLIAASWAAKSSESKHLVAALNSGPASDKKKLRMPDLSFRKSELLSAIPWINRKLLKLDEVVPHLQRLLNQADMKLTVGLLLLMSASCFAFTAYLIYLRTASMIFSLGIGCVMGLLPFGFVFMKRNKRFSSFEQGLPEALDLMVSALRVGQSFNAAIGLVTRECADPVGSEFRICFDEQNYGLDLRIALQRLNERVPLQDLSMVVTAILIQKETGGNLAEVLDKTAVVIRQRFRLRKQVMVHTAQGRLTGWVLTILPIALGIGLYMANPKTMSLLWTNPLGIKLLCTGCAMLVLGTVIIQKVVQMDV